MVEVVWSEETSDQLSEAKHYIGLFDPAAAARIADGLIRLADSLRDYPARGRPVGNGMREMVTVRPYIMRYAVQSDVVLIVSVRHSARRPLA